MKSIGINVNAQTKSPYSVSFTNRYDNNRPLNTIISLDPSKRSFDFQINYDLGKYKKTLYFCTYCILLC